jgi:nucleoside 2-deoxyribosyltransferase
MLKVYDAGPGVFAPNARRQAQERKLIAANRNIDLLHPLDAILIDAQEIYQANLAQIHAANVIIADLSDFRGTEPDSGTVWEYAYAFGLGKKVYGYSKGFEKTYMKRMQANNNILVQSDSRPLVDHKGWIIEDFKLPVNLMLAFSGTLVIGDFNDMLNKLAQDFPDHIS